MNNERGNGRDKITAAFGKLSGLACSMENGEVEGCWWGCVCVCAHMTEKERRGTMNGMGNKRKAGQVRGFLGWPMRSKRVWRSATG